MVGAPAYKCTTVAQYNLCKKTSKTLASGLKKQYQIGSKTMDTVAKKNAAAIVDAQKKAR